MTDMRSFSEIIREMIDRRVLYLELESPDEMLAIVRRTEERRLATRKPVIDAKDARKAARSLKKAGLA